MKNETTQLDAATSSSSMLFDKKKANLKTNNNTNFQIGLVAALLFAWAVVEMTSEQVHKEVVIVTTSSNVFEVEPLGKIAIVPNQQAQVIKVVVPVPPKPLPSQAPPVIVDNSTAVNTPEPVSTIQPITSLAAATLAMQATGVLNATQPSVPAATAVPVTIVSEAPLYPGCSAQMNNQERITCFNQQISTFVLKNFDTNIASELSISQVRFTVLFTLDHRGEVVDVQVKSKEAIIEKEAKRLMSKLPDMTPGKMNNKAVNVQYALPIVFNIR